MKISKTCRAGLPLFAFSIYSTFGFSLAYADSGVEAGADAGSRRSAALPDVVVTASRIDRDSDSPTVPAGAVVIRGDDIRRSGFSNVAEAIEKLGQVRAFSSLTNDGNRIIDLGGFGNTASSNTVVYLDDIRLSQPDLSAANLHTVPVDLIERIEIIPGGQSVAYGEGATGGVVRIITKRDERKSLGGSVTAGLGSYSARELRASMNASAGAFGLSVSGAQDESKGYREGTSIQNKNGSVGLNWREGIYRASFLASTESADSDFPGALSLSEFKSNPRARGAMFATFKMDSQIYNFNLSRQAGERLISLDVNRRDRGSNARFSPDSLTTIAARQDSYTLKFKDSTPLFGFPVSYSVGAEHRDSDYSRTTIDPNPDFSGVFDIQQLNQAFFGSIATVVAEKWRFSFGGRSESVEKLKSTGQQLDRSDQAREFSLSRDFREGVSLQYRYSQDFRVANADEEPSGGFLKTQETRTNQLTLTIKDSPQINQTIRVFKSEGRNEIALVPPNFMNINLDPTNRYGFEHRLEWDIGPSWQLKTKVAYISAEFTEGSFSGKSVPLVPNRQGSLNLVWKPVEGHRLESYFTAASSSRDGIDFGNNEPRIPGFVVADLRYVLQKQSRSVTFALNNISDRSYYTQSYFGGVYPENGRNFRVTVRQSF